MLRLVLALLALMLLSSAASAERRLALLIGNQGYLQSVGPLKNAHKDAAIVGKALAKIGFEVLPILKDGTREQVLLAVHDFAEKLKEAGPEAIGFLYYSGHGVAWDGQNYILPVDVEEPSTRVLSVKGVTHGELLGKLQQVAPQAAHYLVFDACRNNLGGWRGGKGFVPEHQRNGVMIAFATAPGATASDQGSSGAPYATALAAELVRPGQTDLLMFHRVRVSVDRKTAGEQVPWIEDGIRRRDRVLFGGKVKLAPTAIEAERAWAQTKETTDIALLEAFVARYKGFFYGDLARSRIEELKKPRNWASNLPKIESAPDRPFDGYWIVRAVAISGCDMKNWQNRVAIKNSIILFAETRSGQVGADGAFSYTRTNRNYPDRLVKMSGRLKEKNGIGTYSTGTCKGTLTLSKEIGR
jgi:uncharacterized caspase-like protein